VCSVIADGANFPTQQQASYTFDTNRSHYTLTSMMREGLCAPTRLLRLSPAQTYQCRKPIAVFSQVH
jgi:hypothetical protein